MSICRRLSPRFAARIADCVVSGSSDVDVSPDTTMDNVHVTTAKHFIAAGFDVSWLVQMQSDLFGVVDAGVDANMRLS